MNPRMKATNWAQVKTHVQRGGKREPIKKLFRLSDAQVESAYKKWGPKRKAATKAAPKPGLDKIIDIDDQLEPTE